MRTGWVLAVLIVCALFLRIYGIERESLSGDEVWTYNATFAPTTFARVLANHREQGDTSPPLYYFLLNAYSRIVPHTNGYYRAFAAIPNILTIPVLYLFVRLFTTPQTGLLAAFLWTINPLQIFYSRFGRPYTLFVLLSLLSLLFYFHAQKKPRWWLAYFAAGTTAVFVHYYGLFLHLGVLTATLWSHTELRFTHKFLTLNRNEIRISIPLMRFSLSFGLPTALLASTIGTISLLMSWLATLPRLQSAGLAYFTADPQYLGFHKFLTLPITFTAGHYLTSANVAQHLFLLAGIIVLVYPLILYSLKTSMSTNTPPRWLITYTLVVLTASYIVMNTLGRWKTHYLLFLSPLFFLWLSHGIIKNKALGSICLAGILLLSVPPVVSLYTTYYYPPWHEAAAIITEQSRPTDALITTNQPQEVLHHITTPLKHYQTEELFTIDGRTLADVLQEHDRAWLVFFRNNDNQHWKWKKQLEQLNATVLYETNFNNATSYYNTGLELYLVSA
ncbi:glycosyltransferase family 39 protein [Candidatus Woesearchaeota archaeon]|nr:glycosyltransferase family 39 protein [Candidatus Woesearchaeota archaeon]